MASLLKSNLVVAAGTALSRVTGLARNMVFAAVIGKTALADAYTIGNETPNIVYELLIGGVLSATLVPLFTSFVETDDDESTDVVVTVTLVALAVLTALAVLAAPLIFGLYTLSPAEGVDPEALRRVGTLLTRVFLIQIFFYGATGLATALLHSRRRFFAAAWSPILPNLVIVAALLSLPDPIARTFTLDDVLDDSRVRWTLGVGATAGIATMAIVLIPAVLRSGYRFRARFVARHPAVRRLVALSGWTLGYVVANQATIAVVRNLTDPGSGDAYAYVQAYTFFVLPHGLLAVSIATTFAPGLASAVTRKDKPSFIQQASLGARMVTLLTMPAGVLMFALRRPIIGAFFQRGSFTADDAEVAARALGGFSLGLVGFSVYLFVLRAFYAHQDTRTPFIINVAQNALNIVLAFALVGRHGVLGLGAALAISYLVCALWALRILSYKVPGFPFGDVLRSGWRMLVGGALAGEAAWLIGRAFPDADHGLAALGRVTLAGLGGLVVYVAILAALRAPELAAGRRVLDRFRTRRRPERTAEPVEDDVVLEGPSA